jgi:hypothetical protein
MKGPRVPSGHDSTCEAGSVGFVTPSRGPSMCGVNHG